MEISRWDLRRALKVVTDKHYETLNDSKKLTKREYFDYSLYLIEEDFALRSGQQTLSIQYNHDKETTLKFLRYFLLFTHNTNLHFRISYEYGKSNIILFNDNINENILIEIMGILFCESRSLLTDYFSQRRD